MKASRPGTDHKAEFRVYVNGLETPVDEYETSFGLPKNHIIERYVPVSSGDEIMVKGWFEGTIIHGSFDLVCDGSLSATNYIESNDNVKKWKRRTFEWRKALHNAKPDDWKSVEWPSDAAEGKLYVKAFDKEVMGDISKYEVYDADVSMPGVGSVQVVVNVNDDARDNYFNKEWGSYVGSWKHRGVATVRATEIPADHELGIDIVEPVVTRKRALKFRRRWSGTHLGNKPWATFVFYYRNMDAITNAGALPAFEETILDLRNDLEYQSKFARYSKKGKQKLLRAEENGDFFGNAISSSFTLPPQMLKAVVTRSTSPPTEFKLGQHHEQSKVSEVKKPPKQYTKRLGGFLDLNLVLENPTKKETKRLGGTLVQPNGTRPHIAPVSKTNEDKTHYGPQSLMNTMVGYEIDSNKAKSKTPQPPVKEVTNRADCPAAMSNNLPSHYEVREAAEQTKIHEDDLAAILDEELARSDADDGAWESAMPENAIDDSDEQVEFGTAAVASPFYRPLRTESRRKLLIDRSGRSIATADQGPLASLTKPLDNSQRSPTNATSTYHAMDGEAPARAHNANQELERTAIEDSPMFVSVAQAETRIGNRTLSEETARAKNTPESTLPQSSELQQTSSGIKSDFDRLPSVNQISNKIGVEGIDRWSLHSILDDNGPYLNFLEAQAEFDKRLLQVAKEDPSDCRFYLKKHHTAQHQLRAGTSAAELHDTALETTSTVVVSAGPTCQQELEIPSTPNMSTQLHGKPNKALQKRPVQPSDTSATPVKRSKTEPKGEMTPTADCTSRHDGSMSKLAQLQQTLAEAQRLTAQHKADAEAFRRRKAARERRKRQEEQRLEKEITEALEEEKRRREELHRMLEEEEGWEDAEQYEDDENETGLFDREERQYDEFGEENRCNDDQGHRE